MIIDAKFEPDNNKSFAKLSNDNLSMENERRGCSVALTSGNYVKILERLVSLTNQIKSIQIPGQMLCTSAE